MEPHEPGAKRQKVQQGEVSIGSYERYQVAWICALHIEMAAACAMLDVVHQDLPRQGSDSNSYTLGSIGCHNVVIACLPAAQIGTNNAAIVLTHLTRTFPRVRLGLMVGIGGGVPCMADIRLGDVVVGTRVMQVDLGKTLDGGEMKRTATPRIPDQSLSKAVSALRARHELESSRLPQILQQKLIKASEFAYPDKPDQLYKSSCSHTSPLSDCADCPGSELVSRTTRLSRDPVMHYGGIASSNQVMRSGTKRDLIARELDILCFEMEAAGLMDILPCLPVRGICDYADSHKNKEWQKYAAAVSAAYATELLGVLQSNEPQEILDITRSFRANSPMPKDHTDQSNERRQKLLEKLRFSRMNSRRLTIESAHAKTCGWFLDHPDYKPWLDASKMQDHHGFLWVKGKPGVGKSTLMKFTYLKRRAITNRRRKTDFTASFFFNARGELLERSVLGMYRSLLLQVLEAYPDTQQVLDDPDFSTDDNDISQSLVILKDLFSNAVLSLCGHGTQRSLTLFIDALDECGEQQAIDMVQYFEELAEECTDSGIPFRICFSSRHYPYITVRRGIELTLEAQAGHTKDLVGFIENRLRIQNAVLAKELQAQIINKAGGIFLWVILVVDILNQEDANGRLGLRKRLDEIPDDLHTLFKSILMRDEEQKERLLLGILWILFSARPLGPAEYCHALWAGLLPKGLVDPEIPEVDSSDSQDVIHRFVISSTKGFAETTKGNEPIVQFIHESVRDFLIKDRGLQQLWPDHGSDWQFVGQDRLKESCMAYLDQEAIRDRFQRYNPEPSRNASELGSRYPFLGYAAQHVLYHANVAADAVSQDNFISCFPLDYWVKIANLFEKYATRQYAPSGDLLYVLAERGHAALIRTRLRASPKIDVTGGGRYNHPLFAAFAHGNRECVTALLGSETYLYNGVDIIEGLRNQKDLKDYGGRTPLTWAAQEGRLELMELLIQKGASISEKDADGHHPLCRAMHFRQINAITMLVKMGADIEWRGCFVYEHETLLTWASSCGYVGLMQLLLNRGAVIHEKDRSGRTALCAALEAQEDESIKFLIKKGADIHACEKHGLQLLGRSVLEPHLELFETVLVQGSILSKVDEEGRRFLSQSSLPFVSPMFDQGHRGAGRCCEFTEGWTLLGLAAKKNNLPLLELLIRRGADINMSANGYTPLGWAIHNGSESLCRRLIEAGADVNVKGPTGLTPLVMAMNSYFSHEAIAVLLINNGAALDSYDIFGEPPLALAARRGLFKTAKALVEKGADLDMKAIGGSTPLELAKLMKYEKIVNLLATHEGAK